MEHPEETVEGVKNKLLIAMFALCFITVVVLCAKTLSEPKKGTDLYFICSYEKIAEDYFILVYTKNGEAFYPHFSNIRQVISFMNHLKTLGDVNNNGYEIGAYLDKDK